MLPCNLSWLKVIRLHDDVSGPTNNVQTRRRFLLTIVIVLRCRMLLQLKSFMQVNYSELNYINNIFVREQKTKRLTTAFCSHIKTDDTPTSSCCRIEFSSLVEKSQDDWIMPISIFLNMQMNWSINTYILRLSKSRCDHVMNSVQQKIYIVVLEFSDICAITQQIRITLLKW